MKHRISRTFGYDNKAHTTTIIYAPENSQNESILTNITKFTENNKIWHELAGLAERIYIVSSTF
jgi:hypothetical protein